MVTGSILLVIVAASLLVVGLFRGSDPYFYGSIVASVLAALALVVGVRQLPAARMPDDDFDVGRGDTELVVPPTGRLSPRPVGRAGVPRQVGVDVSTGGDMSAGGDGNDAAVPPDEPAEQSLTDAAAAKVARLGTDVVVIDGRPRYHGAECLHLLGREYQRLPVIEAVELGFTPCGLCEPATALLAGTPRS